MLQENIHDLDKKRNKSGYKATCVCIYIYTHTYIYIYNTQCDGVLISYGCSNKLPQSLWLKTAQTNFLIVIEGRSPKSVSLG